MNKLKAIWQIIFANKIAVFTWKEAAPDPTWLTVPTFSWRLSDNWDSVDLGYVLRKVEDIIRTKRIDNEQFHKENQQ